MQLMQASISKKKKYHKRIPIVLFSCVVIHTVSLTFGGVTLLMTAAMDQMKKAVMSVFAILQLNLDANLVCAFLKHGCATGSRTALIKTTKPIVKHQSLQSLQKRQRLTPGE